MLVDLGLVCELVARHLDEDGVPVELSGRKLRIDSGRLTLKLRAESVQDAEAPGSLFWLDVDGLRLEPPMSLDLSGWGTTPEECAVDAAHGLLSSVIPPIRWLAQEPWQPPAPAVGQSIEIVGTDGRGWTAVAGVPWIVVVTYAAGESANALADDIRSGLATTLGSRLDAMHAAIQALTNEPRGHWIKTFAGRYQEGGVSIRIDIDNLWTLESPRFLESMPWATGDNLQLVRQLIVLRPDGETPRAAPRGRLGRLFGRA